MIKVLAGQAEALLPLGQHPTNTLLNLGKGGVVRVSPFCHEHPDSQRQVRGWTLDVPSDAPAHVLPISFNMFDGVTIVECEMTESELFDVMRELETLRRKMGLAVDKIMSECVQTKRATWARCRPSTFPASLERASKDKEGHIHFVRDEDSTGGTPVIDSEEWWPELSPDGFIGLYHHWHKSARDSRLCMYVVCQSYLPKACLEFADLAHQVGEACSAGCVCLSEEAQWLRTACSRNRARLIWRVCGEVGLRVPSMLDYHAHDSKIQMAIPLVETLHHDMMRMQFDKVRLLNYCSETRKSRNGNACVMAPWEGIWIFHGGSSGSMMMGEGRGNFGGAYGGGDHLLPTAAPQVKDRGTYAALTISTADPKQCKALQVWGPAAAEAVVVLPSFSKTISHNNNNNNSALCLVKTEGLDPDVVGAFHKIMLELACPQPLVVPHILMPSMQHYLVFDEHVLDGMVQRGWQRTRGKSMLSPVACALYEHWKKNKQAQNNEGM